MKYLKKDLTICHMTHYKYYCGSPTVTTPNKAVVEFVKSIHKLFDSVV